jgi:UDP-N-acetylglucosamine transferase subunit ALG13
MIETVDQIAKSTSLEIYGQIGEGAYQPKHFKYDRYLTIPEYEAIFDKASIIIGHAGMGTIISALTSSKPILMMARKASLGEHRNEHQQATAGQFKEQIGCYFFNDSQSLNEILCDSDSLASVQLGKYASNEVISRLKDLLT